MLDILKPSLCINSAADLSPEAVWAILPDAEGVAFDLHRTLTDHVGSDISMEVIEMLGALREAGLEVGVMSDSANEARAKRTHQITQGIGRLICRNSDSEHYKVATVTSMDIAERSGKKRGNGKPFRPIFMAIAAEMGIEPKKLLYIGDQIFRDVVGGNRYFGASGLVCPYGAEDNKNVRRYQRPVEAILRPLIGLPFHPQDFGTSRNSKETLRSRVLR